MRYLLGIVLILVSSFALASNAPPGLQKKGVSGIPSFLGNTPPGWDEGLKKGWNKNKDWRWNKQTHYWENKDWKWNNKNKTWKQVKNW